MSEKYTIYLAVPGKQYCWGTVTGAIASTSKHTAFPINMGNGYSIAEDFNMLWADAHNLYEKGKITHFAMMHGDIEPDPKVKWLDVLLDEMDAHGAVMMSAVSPIKDQRGVTSCGIGDIDDPWRPWKRFTIREILTELPETFNNELAGYPDRPLLHNTALWVIDLRHPWLHETDENGELAIRFKYPDTIYRDENEEWQCHRQSEDWVFSMDLWKAGVTNTWITSKVKLVHRGASIWGNEIPWGTYMLGDEDTADKWRPETEAKSLRMLQVLEFELGSKCNMGHEHHMCPNMHAERYSDLDTSQELDDKTIIDIATEAYTKYGFTGLVGWIYYNEPLLQAGRMFSLMKEIKWRAPQARFLLWTNGTLIPEECEQYKQFSEIVVSNYGPDSQRGIDRLLAKEISCKEKDDATLDNRLLSLVPDNEYAPCLRPFVELIIDNYGNTHLCCYDWQGKATLGNVFCRDFACIVAEWRQQLPKIAGCEMSVEAPDFCRQCGHRWSTYQVHEPHVVARAKKFREDLSKG